MLGLVVIWERLSILPIRFKNQKFNLLFVYFSLFLCVFLWFCCFNLALKTVIGYFFAPVVYNSRLMPYAILEHAIRKWQHFQYELHLFCAITIEMVSRCLLIYMSSYFSGEALRKQCKGH